LPRRILKPDSIAPGQPDTAHLVFAGNGIHNLRHIVAQCSAQSRKNRGCQAIKSCGSLKVAKLPFGVTEHREFPSSLTERITTFSVKNK
jgi:hypothetical protein